MSLQHISISGYLLGVVIEPPSNAQHWITAESRAGAVAVWRRNPAGDVSIYYVRQHITTTGYIGKKAGESKGLVLTAANFLATESAQDSGGWHHRVRLVETLSTVCRMPAWPFNSERPHSPADYALQGR